MNNIYGYAQEVNRVYKIYESQYKWKYTDNLSSNCIACLILELEIYEYLSDLQWMGNKCLSNDSMTYRKEMIHR